MNKRSNSKANLVQVDSRRSPALKLKTERGSLRRLKKAKISASKETKSRIKKSEKKSKEISVFTKAVYLKKYKKLTELAAKDKKISSLFSECFMGFESGTLRNSPLNLSLLDFTIKLLKIHNSKSINSSFRLLELSREIEDNICSSKKLLSKTYNYFSQSEQSTYRCNDN